MSAIGLLWTLACLIGGQRTEELHSSSGKADILVRVERDSQPLSGKEVILARLDGAGWELAETDQNGQFLFSGLEFGKYEVSADLPCGEGNDRVVRWVWVGGASREIVLRCERPPVRQVVLALQEQERAGCVSEIVAQTVSCSELISCGRATRRETGEYVLAVSGSPALEFGIELNCMEGQHSLFLPPGMDNPSISLPTEYIKGVVLDDHGSPVRDLSVRITSRDLPQWGWHLSYSITRTGDEGEFRFPHVPPGSYTLAVGGIDRDHMRERPMFAPIRESIDVKNGAEKDCGVLVLQAAHEASFHLNGSPGLSGNWLYGRSVEDEADWFQVGQVRPDGTVNGIGLPGGLMELKLRSGSSMLEPAQITVAEVTGVVEVKARPAVALELCVYDHKKGLLVPFRVSVATSVTNTEYATRSHSELQISQLIGPLPQGKFLIHVITCDGASIVRTLDLTEPGLRKETLLIGD